MYLSQQRDQTSFEGLNFMDCYWGELRAWSWSRSMSSFLPWGMSSFHKLKFKPAHPFSSRRFSWFLRTHGEETSLCQITLTVWMLTRQDPWLCAASHVLLLQSLWLTSSLLLNGNGVARDTGILLLRGCLFLSSWFGHEGGRIYAWKFYGILN